MKEQQAQKLDPFQEYCLRTVGRDMALTFKELKQITGMAEGTLYNARWKKQLVPVDEKQKIPVFHWPTVKQFMQSKGRWAN